MNLRKGIIFVCALIALFVCAGFTTVFAAGIGNLTDADLVANWKFDEESGNTVYDETGLYNGIVTGTTIIDGVSGKARSFDGNDYIQFNDRVIPLGKKSIRFKIRSNDGVTYQRVFANTDAKGTNNDYGYQCYIINNTIGFNVSVGKVGGVEAFSFLITSNYNIYDNQWHDVLFTWDGTTNDNKVKLYIDNMSQPIATATATDKESHIQSYNLLIGRRLSDDTPSYLRGDLDEIEIYNEYYTPPTAPTNLTATAGNAKIDLSWGAVAEAESYTVKRAITAGGPYTTVAENVYGTSYTDTDVTVGTTYYYVVCAVQNGAVSANSNEASATPEASAGRALLVITMQNGLEKEYDMSMSEVEAFISWYNSGTGNEIYTINKHYNVGPFVSRKDYIVHDKIMCFEVMEYVE